VYLEWLIKNEDESVRIADSRFRSQKLQMLAIHSIMRTLAIQVTILNWQGRSILEKTTNKFVPSKYNSHCLDKFYLIRSTIFSVFTLNLFPAFWNCLNILY